MEGIVRGGKKGADSEALLALRTLGLVSITLGTDAESLYKEVYPFLDVIIRDHQRSPAVRSAVSFSVT